MVRSPAFYESYLPDYVAPEPQAEVVYGPDIPEMRLPKGYDLETCSPALRECLPEINAEFYRWRQEQTRRMLEGGEVMVVVDKLELTAQERQQKETMHPLVVVDETDWQARYEADVRCFDVVTSTVLQLAKEEPDNRIIALWDLDWSAGEKPESAITSAQIPGITDKSRDKWSDDEKRQVYEATLKAGYDAFVIRPVFGVAMRYLYRELSRIDSSPDGESMFYGGVMTTNDAAGLKYLRPRFEALCPGAFPERWMLSSRDEDVAAVIEDEVRLLDEATRKNPVSFRRILDPKNRMNAHIYSSLARALNLRRKVARSLAQHDIKFLVGAHKVAKQGGGHTSVVFIDDIQSTGAFTNKSSIFRAADLRKAKAQSFLPDQVPGGTDNNTYFDYTGGQITVEESGISSRSLARRSHR